MSTKNISSAQFIELIFDYKAEKVWNFKGKLPAIVNFYTDWCEPCKETFNILNELSEKYLNKLNIYNVNIDVEIELTAVFGIMSVPTSLFIPVKGTPSIELDRLDIILFEHLIQEYLFSNSC